MSSAEQLHEEGPGLGRLIEAEIRAEMGRRRVSESELARRLGVSHTWTNRRLGGGLGRVALNTDEIERIAAALGMSVDALLLNVYRQLAEAGGVPTRHAADTPQREGQITRQIWCSDGRSDGDLSAEVIDSFVDRRAVQLALGVGAEPGTVATRRSGGEATVIHLAADGEDYSIRDYAIRGKAVV